MNATLAQARSPGLWRTVRLLLGAARKRAAGRQRRQQELMQHRTGKKATVNWGNLGTFFALLLMAALNIGAAFVVYTAVTAGERLEAERTGRIVVDRWFIRNVNHLKYTTSELWLKTPEADTALAPTYSRQAEDISREYGGNEASIERKLQASVHAHGSRDFVTSDDVTPGISALPRAGAMPALLGSIVLLWWAIMLVFQGEGLELDLQRRRHPMWEWLFSHPVNSGAVFLAEMLSPIAANPIYWGAPLFTGFLYGFIYGPPLGLLAGIVVGIPVSVAAACLGKALEIWAILRFSPRTRGAMLGLMSWIGYASMMLFFVCAATVGRVVHAAGHFLEPLDIVPWPWLGLFLGQHNGAFSFLFGVLACWVGAGTVLAASVGFSVWGAQRGLSGNFGRADSAPVRVKSGAGFGREPLYRKELLWFARDRSAIVQTILIPLTVAGFQLFNMRGLLVEAQSQWNFLCGAGILFGTYFLWILGPKSLASEGAALWIALTWPRGLESLLKAKAWLWALISTGIVSLVLLYAAFCYPENTWKIILVGVGWFFFGRSMAEKSVTLVTVTSSSGEPERIPMGRRWAAQLGMLTFSIGVLTQQWHIAIMGIVYSSVTAAAMWENFRARLPYLYDPWSEKLPPPPTLMHAMIAISILVEAGAVFTGIALIPVGRENIATVQIIIYGVTAAVVSLGTRQFLANRGVPGRDVLCWAKPRDPGLAAKPWWCGDGSRGAAFFLALLTGVVGGLALGAFGRGYLAVLHHIPHTANMIEHSQEALARYPGLMTSYTVIAIAFAPLAEEYLFRGLLFRALDREWGGWRAVVGSAAFFAIFHPPLSWLPVGLLGVANALIFKQTGRLAPAVLLHLVYNTVVLS